MGVQATEDIKFFCLSWKLKILRDEEKFLRKTKGQSKGDSLSFYREEKKKKKLLTIREDLLRGTTTLHCKADFVYEGGTYCRVSGSFMDRDTSFNKMINTCFKLNPIEDDSSLVVFFLCTCIQGKNAVEWKFDSST